MSNAPLMLSVSGLRGLVGQSLTPSIATRYAAAFGQWLKLQQPRNPGSPHVVLGRDSRPSGEMFEMAAIAGLISVGCRVTSLGIVSTPSVAVMIEHLAADGGMVITASHNPIIWNGIKALRADGVAPPPEQAQEIINRFKNDAVDYAAVDQLTPLEHNTDTHEIHVQRILKHLDVQAIRSRKLKVVLDSVHGAGGPAASILLKHLGADLTHLYPETTGRFPHQPEPLRENLTELCDAVRRHHADIGFAQDPDADRLAVVDEAGQYIGEEYTLALTCLHLLNRPETPKPAVLVTNLSTSRMIDDIAANAGARVVRTPVGEANVAAGIRHHHAIAGGEGNGGVIWPTVGAVRDSFAGMAILMELLTRQNQPLSQVVKQIPRYTILKDKIDIQPGMAERCLPLLKNRYHDQKTDLQDGIRIDWPDHWVHVRSSNTEPILRIIAEAADAALARQAIDEIRQIIRTA